MANIEELKKIAEEKGIEVSEEMLENIAGGYFSTETWNKMTKEQRKAARDLSWSMDSDKGEYCAYTDPNTIY